MKRTLKKSLILLFALALVMMTTAMPAVSANADVSITFENASMESNSAGDGLLVSNLIPTTNDNENISTYEGYYIQGGIITFNFGTEMDVSTLTPDNIQIELGAKTYISDSNPKFNKTTMLWKYTPYDVTSTSYSIDIADMCEGRMQHKVKFTSGVKTANGEPINEVVKNFRTGRITTTQGVGGKQLMDVAYGKTGTIHESDGTIYPATDRDPAKLLDFAKLLDVNGGSSMMIPGNDLNRYVRIDLGNYYNIYDVLLYEEGWGPAVNMGAPLNIYYTNDPNATYETAENLGALPENAVYSPGVLVEGSSNCGRGMSRYLSPEQPFRARYILLKTTSASGEKATALRVIAEVDTDYGQLTAKKGGSAVTTFAGTGTYEVSVPVVENKTGSGDAYMIIAAYDANGIVTNIECASVKVSGGKLSLSTNIENANARSLKAILIKSFTEPQMLTDALILPEQ